MVGEAIRLLTKRGRRPNIRFFPPPLLLSPLDGENTHLQMGVIDIHKLHRGSSSAD